MTLREFIFGLSRSYSNFLLSIGRANIANEVLYLIRLDYKMDYKWLICVNFHFHLHYHIFSVWWIMVYFYPLQIRIFLKSIVDLIQNEI